jgi:aspartate racemase
VPENPFWGALEVCKATKAAGAHLIVFPCNTWHAWFEVMAEQIKLPMLHIAEATVLSLQKAEPKLPEAPKIGLIATSGTVNSQLYQKAGKRMEDFDCPKITWILPKPESQEKAMKGIYDGVKAGNMELGGQLLNDVALELIQEGGANAFFDACTEVHPAIGNIAYPVPQVDAATALADTAVRLSMALAKLERKFS